MSLIKVLMLGTAFLLVWIFPSSIDGRKFITVSKLVSIKTNKSFPPNVAFTAMSEKLEKVSTQKNQPERVIHLSTETVNRQEDPRPNISKLVLPALTITKKKQILIQANQNLEESTSYANRDFRKGPGSQLVDNSWMQELKPYLRKRLSQLNNDEISEITRTIQSVATEGADSNNNDFPSGAVGAQLGAGIGSFYEASSISKPPAQLQPKKETASYVNATSPGIIAENSNSATNQKATNYVVGPVKVTQGLAVTNDHHIEISRLEEGMVKEKGAVNILQGTYQIELQNPRGFIRARLITAKGQVLGEGLGRISDIKWNKTMPHLGPEIDIVKKIDVNGRTVSAYNIENKTALNANGKVSIFKGYSSHELDKTGIINFDNVVANSSTNVVSQVSGHLPTQQIILANSEFENVVYPQKMIEALKAVVSEQRQMNLNDPQLSVVMGQVLFDKKPTSGIKVQAENFPDIEAVYFNSLMLPDTKLKATSENGYYAIIGVPDEIHHLVANRGDAYFGHINVKVDSGVVSYGKIESTIKTEEVEIKVYDAFSGSPKPAELNLQSLKEKIEVTQMGLQTVYLPSVERWSLLHTLPDKDYQPAYYSYTDKTDYINVPLISKEWLYDLVSELKINIYPSSGIVIGFVHDEDFAVEIPDHENLAKNIIYFDYAGRILKQKSGRLGGGFIIFNMPTDNYEVLVLGAKSQKIYSRMAPVKAQDLFVFNFKLDI